MATAPNRPTWHLRLCAVLVALAPSACDVGPLTGVDAAGDHAPVETVTALEVDVDDMRTDPAVHVRHEASSRR